MTKHAGTTACTSASQPCQYLLLHAVSITFTLGLLGSKSCRLDALTALQVGGLSVINAIAGAYSENLPVICIVGRLHKALY